MTSAPLTPSSIKNDATQLKSQLKKCIGALPVQNIWSSTGIGSTKLQGVPGQRVKLDNSQPGSLSKALLISLKKAVFDIYFDREFRGDFKGDSPWTYWGPVKQFKDVKVMECRYSTGNEGTISPGYYYWYKNRPEVFNPDFVATLDRLHPVRRIDTARESCPEKQPSSNILMKSLR